MEDSTTFDAFWRNNTQTLETPSGANSIVRNGRHHHMVMSINSSSLWTARTTLLTFTRISLSMLAILLLGGLTVTYGQQPVSAARNSVGMWEEDIGYYQSLRVSADSPIFRHVSEYQNIEVHLSKYYGKILMLDNVVQLTERDADSYNEMMAQMPMMQHKNPKRALIIGGGDGYILSEVRVDVWTCVPCCIPESDVKSGTSTISTSQFLF
jgi:hypothetical protein